MSCSQVLSRLLMRLLTDFGAVCAYFEIGVLDDLNFSNQTLPISLVDVNSMLHDPCESLNRLEVLKSGFSYIASWT